MKYFVDKSTWKCEYLLSVGEVYAVDFFFFSFLFSFIMIYLGMNFVL